MASIARKAETMAIVGPCLAVSVLADDSARWPSAEQPTTASKVTRFCDAEWHEAETGSPILEGALAYFDCRLTEHHDGGDHAIFLGEIVSAGYREDAAPLIWYASGYRALAAPDP